MPKGKKGVPNHYGTIWDPWGLPATKRQPVTSARERGFVCHAKGAWKIFGSSHLRKVEELQARCRNKMV